jgi:hypothetical protein
MGVERLALSGGVGLDCCVAGLVWPSAALADRLDLILAALVAAVALTIEPARLRETAGAWQTYRGPRLTGSSWSLGRWRKVSCSAIGPLDQHCLRGPGVDRPTWQTVDQEPVADDIVPLGDRADDLDHDLSGMIAVLARSRISSVQLLEQSLLWLVELLPQSQFCGYAPGSARQARRASRSAAGLLSCVVGAPGLHAAHGTALNAVP